MTNVGEAINSSTRPLVTIALVAVFCAGFLMGRVSADQFVPVVGMALAFWFGQRDKDKKDEAVATAAAQQVVAQVVERRGGAAGGGAGRRVVTRGRGAPRNAVAVGP